MSIFTITVTAAGAALMNRAQNASDALIFTRAQVGGGIDTGMQEARTGLKEPVCYVSVGEPNVNGNILSVGALFTNRTDGGGYLNAFTLNEIGLYAKLGADGAETLIAYANSGDTGDGISVPGDTLTEFTYVFRIAHSGAATMTISAENIEYVTKNDMDAELAKKSNVGHTHAQSAVNGLTTALNGKANVSHVHSQSDVTGLTAALNGKANVSHTHTQGNITGLASALNGKANSSHTHAQSDITGLANTLNQMQDNLKSRTVTATATAAGWTGSASPYTQVINVTGMTATCNAIVGLATSATEEQRAAARRAGITPTKQEAGKITLTADYAVPSVNLPVAITILEVV